VSIASTLFLTFFPPSTTALPFTPPLLRRCAVTGRPPRATEYPGEEAVTRESASPTPKRNSTGQGGSLQKLAEGGAGGGQRVDIAGGARWFETDLRWVRLAGHPDGYALEQKHSGGKAEDVSVEQYIVAYMLIQRACLRGRCWLKENNASHGGGMRHCNDTDTPCGHLQGRSYTVALFSRASPSRPPPAQFPPPRPWCSWRQRQSAGSMCSPRVRSTKGLKKKDRKLCPAVATFRLLTSPVSDRAGIVWVLWKSRVWRRVWRRVGDLHVRHFIIMRPVRLGPTISTAPHQSAATAGRAEARREGSERRMPSGTHFVR